MKKRKILLGILCLAVLGVGYSYRNSRNAARDVEAPVITAESDKLEVKIDATDEQLLEGLSAVDNVDGDLTNQIIIEKIEKDTRGKKNQFKITYVCFDSSENIGRLTRTLVYKNYVRPRFAMSSDLRFPLNSNINLLDYITANDSLDGDISPFITLDGSKDIGRTSAAGKYMFNISVTNSVGDTSTLPIQVELYENSYEEQLYRPKICLKQYIAYVDKGKEFKPEVYIDYVDYADTDDNQTETPSPAAKKIPLSKIEIQSGVNTDRPGIYNVVYKYVSSENGYDCTTRLIVVVE